jgi:hypothetical protein
LDRTPGVIVGKRVSPIKEASRGENFRANVLHHVIRLTENDPPFPCDQDALNEMLASAIPVLNAAPLALVHNDPHAWNVMARKGGESWHCAGWLDWEYARVNDPAFDLARMDLWRVEPIGSTPEAFFEGYGRKQEEPFASLYRLSLYAWMAGDRLDGGTGLSSYGTAIDYVRQLDDNIDRIRAMM